MIEEFSNWHKGRKSFSIMKAATMRGTIQNMGTVTM